MSTAVSDIELTSTYRATLPELAVDWEAAEMPDPRLVAFNDTLAADLGLAALRDQVDVLAGQRLLPGSHPVAMAYAGHQFGSYNPQLGDGRALLLGEVTGPDGQRVDLHLKGSGRTPFARGGDGRAALGSMLREFLFAEAIHAPGIPTTRALAVVTTGDRVHRAGDDVGALLVRVAASHLRVGTFEYAARLPDRSVLQRLTDQAIERHHPGAADADVPAFGLLDAVVGVQAELIAQWMLVGFVHGVMNTDNTTISGETIDYGPCAFMNRFDPDTVFSSIDHGGRYRYAHQPSIAEWNLTRLAESLLPLVVAPDQGNVDDAVAEARSVLETFMPRFRTAWEAGMRRKLGLLDEHDGDAELFDELVAAMRDDRADLTLTFRMLADEARRSTQLVSAPLDHGEAVGAWVDGWTARLEREGRDADAVAAAMDAVNPIYVPRNHLVEEALSAAASGDMEPFGTMLDAVTDPFTARPGLERHARPAPDDFDRTYQTFCGT
ncbi:uncharacterized protein YdiU (UPF0061 family) [Ilumatobacter fluminis]|uniref:Protein nucleotidyltransferase YdiU n=1 Tax=Ilumatobacter fluminis TaxID=467091 RepID=A0A4R7HZX2_9ACTN|nr:YdiU family protein [Ilumatobacter fluminis]TDT16711.1 uncharacterized protein YdiU (UPF0061 family) [Ilumatobacter fluminis]